MQFEHKGKVLWEATQFLATLAKKIDVRRYKSLGMG